MAKQKFTMLVKPKCSEPTQLTSEPFDSINSAASPNMEPAAETKATSITTVPTSVSIVKEVVSRPIELKYIPRKKIVFHENNDYKQEDIEKLAESILLFGLIHPMEAYYDEENDCYILESGERRTRAIDYLLDKYLNSEQKSDSYNYQYFLKHVKGFSNGYPLNVIHPDTTEAGDLTELEKINSLLRLDEANLQVREVDPLQRAKYLERRKKLLQQRNELLPKGAYININKKLAQESGLSERTVMKYTAVAEKLIPELQAEFNKNNISLNEGSAYAQLTEEEQRYILQMLQNGEKASRKELEHLKEMTKKQEAERIQKEAELETLKNEKAMVEKKLNDEMHSKEKERMELEKKLREEIASDNDANEAAIHALEKALQKKEKELADSKKAMEKHLSAKDANMNALQKKLKELKERPVIDPKEQKTLRLTITYETAIHNLETAVTTVYNTYQALAALAPEKEKELRTAYENAVAKFEK